MTGSSVFLVAFFTALVTATSTAFLVERLGIFAEEPRQTVVPDLKGLSEKDARANLQAIGLVLVVGEHEASDQAEPGTVIRQSVPASQRVRESGIVTVTVAAAPPEVPDVRSRSLAEASLILEKEGYKQLVSETVPDDSVPKDHVITQTPEPGASLPKGRSVALRVSSGLGKVEVPKLAGQMLNNAKKQLEELGLVTKVRWVELAETTSYAVLNQKPQAGEELERGQEVEVTVNR